MKHRSEGYQNFIWLRHQLVHSISENTLITTSVIDDTVYEIAIARMLKTNKSHISGKHTRDAPVTNIRSQYIDNIQYYPYRLKIIQFNHKARNFTVSHSLLQRQT